jgi:hypothetical protein
MLIMITHLVKAFSRFLFEEHELAASASEKQG